MLLNPEFDSQKLENIVSIEQRIHPLAKAVDYYKLLYQAYYGPSHMSSDIHIIQNCIFEELKSIEKHYLPMWQDIGDGKAYLRVSLSCLHNGMDPQDRPAIESRASFLSILIMKSRLERGIDREHWQRSWQNALPIVRTYCDFDTTEMNAIQQLLISGQIPHHSNAFRSSYNPHYRIINMNYKQELQDYLEANDILEIK